MTIVPALDAARHCYERMCFTRYAEQVFEGLISREDFYNQMERSINSFDSIVGNAHLGNRPEIYLVKRSEAHNYVDELNSMLEKARKEGYTYGPK